MANRAGPGQIDETWDATTRTLTTKVESVPVLELTRDGLTVNGDIDADNLGAGGPVAFADVASNGTVNNKLGVTSVTRADVGIYDILASVVVATLEKCPLASVATGAPRFIMCDIFEDPANTYRVRTYGADGLAADVAFRWALFAAAGAA